MARSKRKTRSAATPALPEATWWDRLPGGTQHLICAFLLLLVSLAFFAPIHFTGKSLYGGDTVGWRAMAETLIEHREAGEGEALWATNAFGGMPAYMISYPNMVPQADSLVRALNRVLWPTSTFMVLLLGTYFFVFYLTREKLAAVLSACAFGLSTYLPVILTAGHNSKFATLAFVPWLALAFAYALRQPKLLSSLLFAAALALTLRAGHVQIVYYAAFLLGLWWIVEGVGAVRHGRGKAFGASTAWLALGSVLALLMVAQPYLAHAEYKPFTIRGAASGGGEGGLDWRYAMGWSQGWGELVTLLIPGAYGGGGQLYWGPKPFTAGPHYVGGTVLLLALLAVWRLRRNAVWALGGGALLMTLFSLGEYLPALNRPMYEYFPLFAAFRVPETWLSVVAFALAVLAGYGAWYATRREADAQADAARTKAVYTAAGAVLALVLVLVVARGAFFDFQKPGEYEQVVRQVAASNGVDAQDPRVIQFANEYVAGVEAERADRYGSDALRTLLFVALAGALLFLARRGTLPGWGLQLALALLVVVDLWGVDRRYLNEDVLVRADRPEEQIATYDFDRFILEQQAAAGGPGSFRVLSMETGDPFSNARPSYHYESIGGYHGAKLRRYQDYIEHVFRDPRTGLPNANALDLMNTRYVVAGGTLPGTEVVYQGEQALVLENPDAVPRAFLVGQTEVVDTPEATWARLQDLSFDPRRTALLEAPLDAPVTPLDSAATASVTPLRYGPREMAWEVTTDAPRLLVVSEVYYPAGWTATVGGAAAEIIPVDYLLRGVAVPAGTHTVTMRFDPPSHATGLWITAATTALVYGATLVLLGLAWRRRREEPEAEPDAAGGPAIT